MARGIVKWFNPTKGYGFIQPQGGGGRDVFVHISAVERAGLSTLNEGQQIEYEIEENRGKTSAVNLRYTGEIVHRADRLDESYCAVPPKKAERLSRASASERASPALGATGGRQ
jgi:cold shock protein